MNLKKLLHLSWTCCHEDQALVALPNHTAYWRCLGCQQPVSDMFAVPRPQDTLR